jgi:DNA-binding transcriptional regulator YiaG
MGRAHPQPLDLAAIRQALQLSTRQVAEALAARGIESSHVAVWRWERGARTVPANLRAALLDVYRERLAELATRAAHVASQPDRQRASQAAR